MGYVGQKEHVRIEQEQQNNQRTLCCLLQPEVLSPAYKETIDCCINLRRLFQQKKALLFGNLVKSLDDFSEHVYMHNPSGYIIRRVWNKVFISPAAVRNRHLHVNLPVLNEAEMHTLSGENIMTLMPKLVASPPSQFYCNTSLFTCSKMEIETEIASVGMTIGPKCR